MKLIISVLAALLVCVSARDTRQETTCQTHQRNVGGSGAAVHWDIKCDEQGFYQPLQCTVETPKWCACYDKDKAITRPSRSTKQCNCPLAREAAVENSASECDTPQCDGNTGKFQKKQCCSRTGKCHCVDPITGAKLNEPSTNANLKC